MSETSSPTATDGALLDDAAIEAFATKLGCARERAVPPKSSWLLAKGVKTGYDCTAGDIEYTVMRTEKAEQIGPGWEFYLDRLDASRTERPMPDFGDYWPSMGPYYAAQVVEV